MKFCHFNVMFILKFIANSATNIKAFVFHVILWEMTAYIITFALFSKKQ
jgi:hypothetical protein